MNIKELLKKEDRFPLVIIALSFLFVAMSFLDKYFGDFERALDNGEASVKTIITLSAIGIASLIMLLVVIFGIKKSIQYDIKAMKIKKDEREMMHDWLVAKRGYDVAMIGLCVYIFLVDSNPLLLGLIITIVIARIMKRAKIEREN
jgi:hypothetical protein